MRDNLDLKTTLEGRSKKMDRVILAGIKVEISMEMVLVLNMMEL